MDGVEDLPVLMRVLTGFGVVLALTAPALADTAAVPPAVEQAVRTYLTRSSLEAPIRFLSSDLLEGRGPATRADQLVRLYLQTRLEGIGFKPAFANGEWRGNIFGRTHDVTLLSLGKSSLDDVAVAVARQQ